MYTIVFENPAEKLLKKCRDKNLKKKYYIAFEALRGNSYIGRPKTGKLTGIYGYD